MCETCLVNGIDAYQYLKALRVELAKAKTFEAFEALLPWRIVLNGR